MTQNIKRIKPYLCPECKKPCAAIKCDDGIGPVEFWGATSVDRRPYMGSDCCYAEIEGIDPCDDLAARADWAYDCARDDKLTGDD